MATAAGIQMSECLLLPEGPRAHFMTKRFDRSQTGERHHVLSLAAVANLDARLVGTHSYDQYLQAVVALGIDGEGLQQAFRRMVFNVMGVNRDDHTKNFGFLFPHDGRWSLAPAFDVTHTYRPTSPWTSRHNLSVNGRLDAIELADLYAVGERNGVPGYRRLVREVGAAVDRWREFADEAGLDQAAAIAVAADIDRFRPA
jgi:serine/threonine-protein kinase HipA